MYIEMKYIALPLVYVEIKAENNVIVHMYILKICFSSGLTYLLNLSLLTYVSASQSLGIFFKIQVVIEVWGKVL